jgi:hypothetical protein
MGELMWNPKAMTKLNAEVRRCATKGKDLVTEEDLSNMSYQPRGRIWSPKKT